MQTINTVDIGQRIKFARNKRGMTQESLGKLINASKQLICSWEQGRSEILSTDLAKVSLLLGFDLIWLVFGGNLENSGMPLVQTPTVPLLTVSQVLDFSMGELDPAAVMRRIAVSRIYSERTFCVRMSDDGMSPSLLRGDYIVVDPKLPVEPCSMIAAVLSLGSCEHKVLIREVSFDRSNAPHAPFQLSAVKKGYPSIRVKKETDGKVLGTVTEVIRQLIVQDAGEDSR